MATILNVSDEVLTLASGAPLLPGASATADTTQDPEKTYVAVGLAEVIGSTPSPGPLQGNTVGTITFAGTYDSTKSYVTGQLVLESGLPYLALPDAGGHSQTIYGHDPATSPTYWQNLVASPAGAALLSSPNTFSAKQTVNVAGDQAQLEDGSGNRLVRFTNIATSPHYSGAMVLAASSGLGTGGEAWGVGIDVAAPTPYRDFAIFRVETGGSVSDQFYGSHNGSGNDPTWAFGMTPAPAGYRLTLRGPVTNVTPGGPPGLGLGTLQLYAEPSQTGYVFALYSASKGKNMLQVDPAAGSAATWQHTYLGDSTTSNPIIVFSDVNAAGEQFRITANGRIQFAADSNALLYRSAAGIIAINNNLAVGGRIGVGTGTGAPAAMVDIEGGASTATFQMGTTSGATLNIRASTSAATGVTINTVNGSAMAFGTNTASPATIKLGTVANTLAFFGATPIAQPSAVGTATGYTAGATVATFHSDDTYTGNVGTTAYTINGVVAALKNLGLIAS